MSSLMKGTAILTIGMFLSKVLGLVYIFPFYAIIGEDNIALYQYAYIPYSIMLSVAISGLPLAVSKFVSKYNTMGDYESGYKLMKSGLVVMTITGFASFLILNLLATPIAEIVISSEDQAFSVEQVAFVIRWVSYALIVVPFMSLCRGFFQGYNKMQPTAVSQLVEQIVRIVFLLLGSYLIVVVFQGDPEAAISLSVFAAFIGGVGGLLILGLYWKKYRSEFSLLRDQSLNPTSKLQMTEIYKEVLTYSLPIIFVGMANPLFQLVDLLTFNSAMNSIGMSQVSDIYFMMINFTTHKVVIIPVMLATSLSLALIPTITKYFTQGDYGQLRNAMDKSYQILFFITLPAALGISVLANEIYFMLYSESEMGATILAHYAPVAILFALFQVTAALLQGIDYQKWIIFSLLTGILVKLMINTPLVKVMQADGAILATAIGYGISILINIIVLKKVLNYQSTMVKRRILLIVILSFIMTIAVFITQKLLIAIMGPVDSKLSAMLISIICVGVGIAVYSFLSFKLGLAQKMLGERITKFASKFGLR
ncbi:putative cell division protein YtgP [Lysinibacillus sp. PLM2]|nr:putative cell division protein YtgP [Lysinibacillus sp. PLM2]